MPYRDQSNEPHEPPASNERERSAPRGFGELSGGYRARWALSHPDMRRQWGARDDTATSSAGAVPVRGIEQAPDAGSTGVDARAPMPNDRARA